MAAITVLNKGNVPTGPFTRAQVAEKLQSGEFSLNDLAFVEGLSQWTPLREVLARVDGMTTPAPSPVAAPPAAVAAYSYAATMAPPAHLVYAGFWLRFVAYLVDGLIVGAVVFAAVFFIGILVGIVAGASGAGFSRQWSITGNDLAQPNSAAVALIFLVEAVIWGGTLMLSWLYFALLESGPAQATYGKRVLGLRVTDMAGERIGFGRASGRFFGKIVSGLTFYIGFMMAGFTERKQALHDMMAGTLVVRN